jgi:predicted transposase YdaD
VAVTLSEEVERQAALPIVLGPGATLQPLVIGPGAIPRELEPAEIEAMPALGLLVALAHRRDAAAMQVRNQTLLTAARLPREERIPLMRLLAPTLSAATLRMEEGNMQDEEMDALMIQFMARTTDRIDEAEDQALARGIEIGRTAGMEFGKALRLERVQRETTLRIASRLLPLEVVNRLRLIQDPEALADAAADAIRARMH